MESDSGRDPLRVLIAAPGHMVGGQAHAARSLLAGFRSDPVIRAEFQAIDPRLPGWRGVLTRWPLLRSLVRPLLYGSQLWRAARGVDVIHAFAAAHTAFLFGALPAICVGRLRKRAIVLNYHDGRAEAHLQRWGSLLRWLLLRCDAIVVPSRYLEAAFARAGVRVSVIPNVVDTEAFSYHEVVPLPPRLLSVRSLESLYAVGNTIAAFALLKRDRPELVLELYGSGPEEPKLRALVERLRVTNVQFRGAVAHEAMGAVLARGGIVVNSSRVDNQPLFILEAFASGAPVVSTAAGGIPFMIRNGENGLLAPLDDPGALAAQVRTLLGDPALALRLVRTAHAELSAYTWSAVRDSWVKLYVAVGRAWASQGAAAPPT